MNQPVRPPSVLKRPLPEALGTALRTLVGDRFSSAEAVRAHHGKDESAHPHALPDAVVYAEATEEVAAIVKLCAAHRVPVIPFGAGSSVEGHVLAIHGGIALDLTRMNRVLAVNV